MTKFFSQLATSPEYWFTSSDGYGNITQISCANGAQIYANYTTPQTVGTCVSNKGVTCLSTPNRCGMTNSGSVRCGGTCSVTTPSDALCPACVDTYRCSGSTITNTCTNTTVASCDIDHYCTNGSSTCHPLSIGFDVFLTGDDSTNGSGIDDKARVDAGITMSGHLTALPKLVQRGHSTRLFWNTSHAKSCTVSTGRR